jgi:hypothetical protein
MRICLTIFSLMLGASAAQAFVPVPEKDCSALTEFGGEITSQKSICIGTNAALQNRSCDDLPQHTNTSPFQVCNGTKAALQNKSCDDLPTYSTTSPRAICIGTKAALLGDSCEALPNYTGNSPKWVCVGTRAALKGQNCATLPEFPNTNPRSICIATALSKLPKWECNASGYDGEGNAQFTYGNGFSEKAAGADALKRCSSVWLGCEVYGCRQK